MYQIDFHTPIHVHFIGIGGISSERAGRDSSEGRIYRIRF